MKDRIVEGMKTRIWGIWQQARISEPTDSEARERKFAAGVEHLKIGNQDHVPEINEALDRFREELAKSSDIPSQSPGAGDDEGETQFEEKKH